MSLSAFPPPVLRHDSVHRVARQVRIITPCDLLLLALAPASTWPSVRAAAAILEALPGPAMSQQRVASRCIAICESGARSHPPPLIQIGSASPGSSIALPGSHSGLIRRAAVLPPLLPPPVSPYSPWLPPGSSMESHSRSHAPSTLSRSLSVPLLPPRRAVHPLFPSCCKL